MVALFRCLSKWFYISITKAGGQRIYPDKKDVTDLNPNGPDRSIVKINANVLPAASGLKVYFGSFDLDDPSANGLPIDTTDTIGPDGKDNNGQVNGSKSGNFTHMTGSGCETSTQVTGTAPNFVSTIDCIVEAGGTSTAYFRTTMQPGDNFAIAASVDSDYRNGMRVNASNGSQVINSTNQPITVSGEANPNNIAGIRTNMLTVWRKLHIEVDSMGPARENYVRDNVSGGQSLPRGRRTTINVSSASLEVNRFENGRMVLASITSVLEIISNTAYTVTVRNSTASDITIASNVNFQLSSLTGTRTAVGTIPAGQTITQSQTVTLGVTGTPLDVNAFSGGQMYITPLLRTLTVHGNTANAVDVTNPGPNTFILDGTNFRLYDDDDMNDEDVGNLNGDEGDDVPEPNTDLLLPNDTACIVNPTNGQITNSCNVLRPAYIRPADTFLPGSHDNIPFVANIPGSRAALDTILSAPNFNNSSTEASVDFWTVYLLGGYQFNEASYSPGGTLFDIDGDPYTLVGGLVSSSYGVANVSNDPINNTRFNDGSGSIVFTELGRPNEYPTNYASRPVGNAYTTAHEVGHLFSCQHGEGGLMEITPTRTAGMFSETSLSWIRKATHP